MIRSLISGFGGSNDLLNFVQRTSSFGTSAIQCVAYGNGLFVAGGASGKLATSSDGITWTQRTSAIDNNMRCVAYGNGLFVAAGFSGKLATSPDGITWTQGTSSFGTNNISGIGYGNGLFVAVGASGMIATSQYQGE